MHRHVEDDALLLAILRHERQTGVDGISRVPDVLRPSAEEDFAAARGLDSEEREQHLRTARADQSSHADDLAGAQAETEFMPGMGGSAKRADFQRGASSFRFG